MVRSVIWLGCSGGLVSLPEASSHTVTALPAASPRRRGPCRCAGRRQDPAIVPAGRGRGDWGAESTPAEPPGRCACPRPAPGPRSSRRGTSSAPAPMAASGPPARNAASSAMRIQVMARSVALRRGLPSSPGVRACRVVLGGRAGIARTVITSWSGCATTTASRPSAYRGTCLDRPCRGRAGHEPATRIAGRRYLLAWHGLAARHPRRPSPASAWPAPAPPAGPRRPAG
jgi:hypothetical protein